MTVRGLLIAWCCLRARSVPASGYQPITLQYSVVEHDTGEYPTATARQQLADKLAAALLRNATRRDLLYYQSERSLAR